MSTQNKNGINELMLAASRGDHARVEALLGEGSDPNARDAFGQTALMYAAGAGNQAVVEELIDAGADVEARNRNGRLAPELAEARGHAGVAALLRNARLFLAARDGNVSKLNDLLDSGLDPNVLLRDEWTALMIAERKGHEEVARLLKYTRAERPLPPLIARAAGVGPEVGLDLADFPDHIKD